MSWTHSLVVAAALAAFTFPAGAATVTVSQTLDITQPQNGAGLGGWQNQPPFSPPFSVEIAEGDTFDFTVDFLGDQALTLENATFLWAFSYANSSSQVTATGTFSFLDADGNAFLTSVLKTTTEGEVHLGQQFGPDDFNIAVASGASLALPSSITFSGVRYTGVVDDYIDDAVTVRTYDDPAFFFEAENFIIDPGNAVPEPATWAMMLLGFGLVGAAVRRQPARLTA